MSARERTWSGPLLAAPALLLLLSFFAGPLLLLLRVSLYESAGGQLLYRPGTWTLAGYAGALTDGYFREVLGFTILLGLIVTLVVLAFAYPLALFIHGLSPSAKAVALAAVLLPKLASALVVLYGLRMLLSGTGPVNRVLLALGVVQAPVMLSGNLIGVVISEAYLIVPYAVLVLVSALERIDPALVRAARGLGASPWRASARITLPLSLPGLALTAQLSLIWALGALLGPMLLGSPQEITLSVEVYHQTFENSDWPRGAVTAVLMLLTLAVCLALYAVPARLARRAGEGP